MTREEILREAKPILFNTDMVRAILDGSKSVTRRVIKPQPILNSNKMWVWIYWQWIDNGLGFTQSGIEDYAPYQPGNILYVRETWFKNYYHEYGKFFYRADGEEIDMPRITGGTVLYGKADGLKWHPSIHMPKDAARLFLRVKAVRAERLQAITEEQAYAEGNIQDPYDYQEPDWYEQRGLITNYEIDTFAGFWDSTIKKADLPLYGWDANPWVWVIEFERVVPE